MARLKLTRPIAIGAVGLGALTVGGTGLAAAKSLDQLSSAQSSNRAHQHEVSAELATTGHQIATLTGQVALIDGRLSAVQSELAADQAQERTDADRVKRAHAAARRYERRLQRARTGLASQLVSRYEQGTPSLVQVVIESKGYRQLLESVDFIERAEHEEQSLLRAARTDKARADAAATRARKLRSAEARVAAAHRIQERSLSGMQAVLDSRQNALADVSAAQSAALAAARSHGAHLAAEIAEVKQQEAAARAAARALAASTTTVGRTAGQTATSQTGTSLATTTPATAGGSDAYGQWAIPASIVMCESGGQNLPPNSAGASGYYQIIPSTWTGFGGTGPAAYLASKAQQDAVAARIWRGGAGAQDWVCAGIVGIS
jgi:septal ring factor EnvC (AmiA/AmiB activator)